MTAVYPTEFDRPFNGLEFLEFYPKHNVYHPGWDLNKGSGDADLGNMVVSPVAAKVEYVSPEPTRMNNQNSGLGWFVVLYHPILDVYSRYAHLNHVYVKQGDSLKKGEHFADVGKTGTGYAHLHFEVFPEKTFNIMKAAWRPFAYYPSGQTKAWVIDHFIDGLAWIDSLNANEEGIDKEFEKDAELMMELKVTDGSRPKDPATREETWAMLACLYRNLTK